MLKDSRVKRDQTGQQRKWVARSWGGKGGRGADRGGLVGARVASLGSKSTPNLNFLHARWGEYLTPEQKRIGHFS